VLAGLLAGALAAQAEWLTVSGYAGHLRLPDQAIKWSGSFYSSGTLIFGLDPETFNYVNFSVPTRYVAGSTLGVQKIRFRIATSQGAEVNRVQVYNGSVLVQTFDGNWTSPPASGSSINTFKEFILTLSKKTVFKNGVGLSFRAVNPDTSIPMYFRFAAVGADFVE
jgi:hypothetical protein